MDKKKAMRIIWVALGSVVSLLFVFFVLPKLLIWFLPFVLAYVLTKIIEPLVGFLKDKLKISRKIGAGIGIIIALAIIGLLLSLLIGRIVQEVSDIVSQSDVIIAKITEKYDVFRSTVMSRFGFVGDFDHLAANVGTKLSDFATSHAAPAVKGIIGIVMGIPSAIIFFVVFILATYFMSSDREVIVNGMRRFVPHKTMEFTETVVHNVFSALGAYVKAQLILICITFCELTVGFLIIGGSVADYALLLGLIISIIDAIPILGTGTVLIPWGVYSLVVGDIRAGIMLLVLYLICLAVRQLTEPRLVAHQVGVHPLLMLMLMYTGLRIMGLFGMILAPVLALVVKNMYKSGVFSKIGQYIQG